MDIKAHSYVFVLLNVNETFVNVGKKYIGLVIATTNLDIDFCGKSMDFGFIWLPCDEKMLVGVEERN